MHEQRRGAIYLCVVRYAWLGLAVVWAQGTIRGSVIDNEGEPVAGAQVFLFPLQKGTLTNVEGLFSLTGLPYGKYRLRITALGIDTLWAEVELSSRRPVATLKLQAQISTIAMEAIEIIESVAPARIDPTRVTVAVTPISPRQILQLPSFGAPDIAQYLQVIPGVVFTGDQGGQLYIRGGTPIQTLTLLDGAIIYSPFHTLSLFSVFETDILRQVNVYSAGFGAEYGGRISSVIDLRTRAGDFDQLGGKVYVTPFVSGGLLEGPTPLLQNSSWLITARQGYIQQAAPRLYPYLRDSLPFQFQDLYGKITFGRGPDQINLWGFRQTDRVDLGINGQNDWTQWGGGLSFSNLPPSTRVRITGQLAYTRFSNTFIDPRELRPRYSEIGGFNGGFTFSYLFGADELAYSVDVRGFSTDFLFTNALGFITQQRQSNTEMAAWVKYQKVFRKEALAEEGERLQFQTRAILEPSLRVHFYNTYGYLSIEPRLRTKYNLTPNWSLQAAAGRYVQNWVAAVSDRDVVLLFQGFLTAPELPANRQLAHPLQEAYHATFGTEYQLKGAFLSAEGWYKRFTQLTIINRERLFPDDPPFLTEVGYAYGADFTLRYQSQRWSLYGTYSYQYNRRSDFRIEYFPLWDRRHTINLLGSYRWGGWLSTLRHRESRWEASLRWTLGSGLPFTQTLGFFEKLLLLQGSQSPYPFQQGQLTVLLSPNYNAARLPAYHRMDLTLKRRWRLASQVLLEANFTLLNVYNRPNLFYIDRITARRYNQLPILPTLGITITW